MEANYKKTRMITGIMMGAVFVYGLIAFAVSDRHGYGASSEAKMNFIRVIVFFVSAVQILLAFVVRKAGQLMPKNPKSSRLLTLQIMINAFCEVIALFGLILVFMTKNFLDYAIFGFISLGAFMFFFPKQKDWQGPMTGV